MLSYEVLLDMDGKVKFDHVVKNLWPQAIFEGSRPIATKLTSWAPLTMLSFPPSLKSIRGATQKYGFRHNLKWPKMILDLDLDLDIRSQKVQSWSFSDVVIYRWGLPRREWGGRENECLHTTNKQTKWIAASTIGWLVSRQKGRLYMDGRNLNNQSR